MISGAGTIGVTATRHGVSVADNSRTARLFKITSGANPYTASEVTLVEADGTRAVTGVYDVTSAQKVLYEINGNAAVKPGRIVIGHPNPAGVGFFFDADGLAPTARIPVDFCVIKSGGNVTDIKVTWLNADGSTECETVPTCTGSTCDDLWWCTTTGVVSLPPGTEPDPADYYSGPYPTYAEALAACDSDSGGPGEPAGGTASCCSRALNSVLTATLSGGNGSTTLTWDGSTYWSGSKTLTCGMTTSFRFSTSCGLEFNCGGASWVPASAAIGSPACGPPFVSLVYTVSLPDIPSGCTTGGCTTFTVTVSE